LANICPQDSIDINKPLINDLGDMYTYNAILYIQSKYDSEPEAP